MSNNTLSPGQIRAAMALLNWSNDQLAEAAGVSPETVYKLKSAMHEPTTRVRAAIRTTLEAKGIEFTDHDGVRRRPEGVEIFEGPERFAEFTAYTLAQLERDGGELCISVTDERLLQRAYEHLEDWRARMMALTAEGRITGRILATDGDFRRTWADLRRQQTIPGQPQASFYVFGGHLALVSLEHDPSPYVVLHKHSPFAAIYKAAFEAAWDRADPV